MLSPRATRIRSIAFNTLSRLTSAVALMILCPFAGASTAATTPDCSASGDSFKCSMLGFLHFLYAAAGLLAIVLIAVVLAAVHIYRRNKNSVEEDQ